MVKFAIHPHGLWLGRSDTGHHRPREIDRPEARIKPLYRVGLLTVSLLGEPECHVECPLCGKRAAHGARDLAA